MQLSVKYLHLFSVITETNLIINFAKKYPIHTLLYECIYISNENNLVVLIFCRWQARIQRGGDRGSGPPLRFVRGGVLCRGLTSRRGGPTVVFTLLLSFFSGSLRLPVLYKFITSKDTSKLNVQYGTAILSIYVFPLSKL